MHRFIGISLVALISIRATMAQGDMPPSTPKRVVSMNLCTDQLAMMLASDDQLISVSYLSRDSFSSAMADEAQNYDINHARAEEIYLMKPDLVLAGAYSSQASVEMLRRLDVSVVVVPPAQSLQDVGAALITVGHALGQQYAAQTLLDSFESDLLALTQDAEAATPLRAAIYEANGWTVGNSSLAGQILMAAGLHNIAEDAGLSYGGVLPLELLVLEAPDLVVSSAPYPGHSRSEALLSHPVIETFKTKNAIARIHNGDWICGTPHVVRAITQIRDMRQHVESNR